MKLHCEVEVVSRHLPALGLRNRGKGVRAVLSLSQQTPKNSPRPPAGDERGGQHPACLLISTLKDKRGTRYEVRGASRPCQGSQPRALPLSREAGGSRDWSPFWGFVSHRPLSPITAPVPGSWACPEDPKRKLLRLHLLVISLAHFCDFELTALLFSSRSQPRPFKASENSAR